MMLDKEVLLSLVQEKIRAKVFDQTTCPNYFHFRPFLKLILLLYKHPKGL